MLTSVNVELGFMLGSRCGADFHVDSHLGVCIPHRISKGCKKNLGSFAWQVGDFMDIIKFHAQRGFAFVEEEALELTPH